MKLKQHPLLVAVLLIVLGGIGGAVAATIIYEPYDLEARARAQREGVQGVDFGDAAFAYAVIGTAIGSFIGLLSGTIWYVKVKAQGTEVQSLISERK